MRSRKAISKVDMLQTVRLTHGRCQEDEVALSGAAEILKK